MFPKQIEFLGYEGRDALYGGSAGPGKSVALLAAALQYVTVPGYSALLMRRTFAQLAKSDSILEKAKEWLIGKPGVNYTDKDKRFTFLPFRTILEFGHMENETSKFNYQGGSWAYIGVDEATQFTGSMLSYPRSRQRRNIGSTVPIRWRGASNPGGVGHSFIKTRYIKRPDGTNPSTPDRQYFPAKLSDNPHIDRADYIKQLRDSGIDRITLEQLLDGNWDAVAGGRFKPEWFQDRYTQRGDYVVFQKAGVEGRREVRWLECDRFATVDPAASEKTTADYTVMIVWLRTPWNELVLWDAIRFQAAIPDIVPRIESLSRKWGCSGVWIEAVASNNAVYQLAKRTTMPAKSVSPLGLDKLVRSTAAMNMASEGRIWLPVPGLRAGLPLEDIESELYRFTGTDDDANDDVCLAAGTKIETDYGPVNIESIRIGDRVLTRSGFRYVLEAGMTAQNAQVVELMTDDGSQLIGTPSHRVFVHKKGFTRLDALSYGDTIVTCENERRPVSTGSNTIDTRARSVGISGFIFGATTPITNPLGHFIATSGRFIMDRFQMASKFITKTASRLTTNWEISSPSALRNIENLMPNSASTARQRSNDTSKKSDLLQKLGTLLKRGVNGIAKMPKHYGRTSNRSSSNASSVAENSPRCSPTLCFAQTNATPRFAGILESMTKIGPVKTAESCSDVIGSQKPKTALTRVLAVEAIGVAPVYNLKVEGEPEYFANGILTHNCDATFYGVWVLNNGPSADTRKAVPMIIGGM